MTEPGASTRHPLADLGFDGARVDEVMAAGLRPGSAARVVRMDRGWATVQGGTGTRRIRLRECPPIVVGDWLAEDGGGTLVRLGRRSLLVRKSVSGRDEPQEMAANVDVVLVTWALDTRVSSGRLRDMLLLAHESGARPILVLSKVDTTRSVDGLLAELDGVLDGVEVVTTSAVTGEGIDRLQALAAGRTIVLLGSSGAGKSTLTNVLLGAEERETAEVGRTGDGRHTTTSRELLPLPGGGAIIDTPGIRAATRWEDEEEDEAESGLPRSRRVGRGVPVQRLRPPRHPWLRARTCRGRRRADPGPPGRVPRLRRRAGNSRRCALGRRAPARPGRGPPDPALGRPRAVRWRATLRSGRPGPACRHGGR